MKTNKVLKTSAKLSNNNINDSTCKVNSPPTGKKSTRTSSGGNLMKNQKLNKNSTNTEEVSSKFGNSNSENEQSPREPWPISPNKSIKSQKTKVGVVLKSSGRIPKNSKCNNPKIEDSTPHKISTLSKIKTPLTEPITRTVRSRKKSSRQFISVKSRSSWSVGMVTPSHRSVKC